MKNNRWNLINAFADFTAGICFVRVAALQDETLSKVLFSIAAIGFLAGGTAFLCACKGKSDRQ